MNDKPQSVRIDAVVFCDDIRKEVTNKDLLIGVYAGDIVLQSFPNWFNTAIWIEIVSNAPGTFELNLRLNLTDKNPLPISLAGQIIKAGATSAAIVGLQLFADKESELSLEIQEGETWRILKSKKIVHGTVTQPFPPVQSRHTSQT
jgi:hypothetical protein